MKRPLWLSPTSVFSLPIMEYTHTLTLTLHNPFPRSPSRGLDAPIKMGAVAAFDVVVVNVVAIAAVAVVVVVVVAAAVVIIVDVAAVAAAVAVAAHTHSRRLRIKSGLFCVKNHLVPPPLPADHHHAIRPASLMTGRRAPYPTYSGGTEAATGEVIAATAAGVEKWIIQGPATHSLSPHDEANI